MTLLIPHALCCNSYGTCATLLDPHECSSWYVYDSSDFVLEPNATCIMEPLECNNVNMEKNNTFSEDFEVVMPDVSN